MEACLGAGGVGLFALAALLQWYGRAQHANCMQPTQFVNGHYGAGCCVRRALHVACMDQDSRITLALGYQRGFIVHLGALDGPAKWLCL